MSIEALLFGGDGSDESVDLSEWSADRIPKDQLLWIDLESADAGELKLVRGSPKLDDGAARALDAEPTNPIRRSMRAPSKSSYSL